MNVQLFAVSASELYKKQIGFRQGLTVRIICRLEPLYHL